MKIRDIPKAILNYELTKKRIVWIIVIISVIILLGLLVPLI